MAEALRWYEYDNAIFRAPPPKQCPCPQKDPLPGQIFGLFYLSPSTTKLKHKQKQIQLFLNLYVAFGYIIETFVQESLRKTGHFGLVELILSDPPGTDLAMVFPSSLMMMEKMPINTMQGVNCMTKSCKV